MKIREYPITSSFYILLFEGRENTRYHVSRNGTMIEDGNYISNPFTNEGTNLNNKEVVGKILQLSESTVLEILERANVDNMFINYQDETKNFKTAKESLLSYITLQGWDGDLNNTYLVALKKSKQLRGKKIPMEFEVGSKDFKYCLERVYEELDVFMTPINKKSKSVKFSVKIPDFIYNKAMTNTEVGERPLLNYIEADTIATLHSQMNKWVQRCRDIYNLEKSAETATKYIYISFSSGERPSRDDFNFAYTGQRISLNYNYFIAFKTNDGKMFTTQRLQSGNGSTDKGIKGLIGKVGGREKYWIRGRQFGVQIKWTQEKEDFLKKLEGQFRLLSQNLNEFLKDINEEKLLELMENGIKLLGDGDTKDKN